MKLFAQSEENKGNKAGLSLREIEIAMSNTKDNLFGSGSMVILRNFIMKMNQGSKNNILSYTGKPLVTPLIGWIKHSPGQIHILNWDRLCQIRECCVNLSDFQVSSEIITKVRPLTVKKMYLRCRVVLIKGKMNILFQAIGLS